MSVLFGVAGNPTVFTETVSKASADLPVWLSQIGLDAYEYQCGKGVRIGQATAEQIGQHAAEAGIALSLHAPYFISLGNPDPESVEKTIRHVTASCQAARWMGAKRIIIHSGALMKRSRREALEIAKENLAAVISACDALGYGDLTLCPETMGKINQLGDLEEVLELCSVDKRLLPCVDFGHLYARSLGELTGKVACVQILDRIAEVLGERRGSCFHIHFSKIEYTQRGGEKRHLCFSDPGYGPEFRPLAEELARRSWGPWVICESAGTQSQDAQTMKQIYREVCVK